jgi:hypothetical protein
MIEPIQSPNHFPVEWSDSKLAELRQIIATPEIDHPTERDLAPAWLDVAASRFDSAEAAVLAILRRFSEPEHRSAEIFFPLLSALFVVRRLDVAAALLEQRFELPCKIELAFSESADDPGFDRLRWTVALADSMRFTFDRSFVSSDLARENILRFFCSFPLFAWYAQSAESENGSVIFNLWDVGLSAGLAMCAAGAEFFLVPDAIFIDERGYEAARNHFEQNDVPWDERRAIAFWRGTTTGLPTDPESGWRSLPRIALCEIGRDHRDLIDAGISDIVQIEDQATIEDILASDLMSPFVPTTEFNRYKYHIDIDGNSNSWPGLFQKLLTGSPVLKVASSHNFRQWYYHRLTPWLNFVPIAADLSDLVDTILWLWSNDDVAKAIGENGRALALSLDYAGELERAATTVTAALRDFGGKPEMDLLFGPDKPGNAYLRDGWFDPEEDGVPAEGVESRVELPCPVAATEFEISLEVSPYALPPDLPAQRLAFSVNGEILFDSVLEERQTVALPLSRRTIEATNSLSLLFLHPDGRRLSPADHPLDDRAVSVRLHRISLMPVGLVEMAGQSGSFAQTPTHVQYSLVPLDPSKMSLFATARKAQLGTSHETVLYIDAVSGALRHGPQEAIPQNVWFNKFARRACLSHTVSNGACFGIRIGPEPEFIEGFVSSATADGIQEFSLVTPEAESVFFGLESDRLFLCAEDDGSISLSRRELGPWELFRAIDPV